LIIFAMELAISEPLPRTIRVLNRRRLAAVYLVIEAPEDRAVS
jgi:hypothetical protein